jgi:hypothetical protein
MSPADYQAIIAGTYQAPQATAPAVRAEAYAPAPTAPSYGQVQVGPNFTAPVVPATSAGKKELYTSDQKTAITTALGSDWQKRLDTAALNGDYAIIASIQNQIDAVLNPAPVQS